MKPKIIEHAIAMGVGRKTNPHFYYADIDDVGGSYANYLQMTAPHALIYGTSKGFHVISRKPISKKILQLADKNNMHSAVRIYPYDDYNLVQKANGLCIRVDGIYQMIFADWINTSALPCTHEQPLKFGYYRRLNPDGTKYKQPTRKEV